MPGSVEIGMVATVVLNSLFVVKSSIADILSSSASSVASNAALSSVKTLMSSLALETET